MRGTRTTVISALTAAILAGGAAASIAASASGSSYTIWRIGGTAHQCSTPPACTDGGAATGAQLTFPEAVAVGRSGNVFIADSGDNEVRKLSPNGRISLVAGSGAACQDPPRCGDGQAAVNAHFSFPDGVAVDGKGNVFIADTGDNEIRMVTPSGKVVRLAGTGSPCSSPPACGDGGPATKAQLTAPSGIALDTHGNLYIADSGDHEVRMLSRTGKISRVVGTGAACSAPTACGNGGPPKAARLRFPQGVAVNRSGIFIADSGDQQVRKVAHGRVTLVAGTGATCSKPSSCGDGGPATRAQLNFPDSVAVGAVGSVYVADAGDNEIRVVSTHGTISRLAGNGSACGHPPSCGDNHTSSHGRLSYPQGVAVDGRGNVYVADTYDNELRWVSKAHAAHIPATGGSVALAGFSASVKKTSVLVRYVTGAAGTVSLTVSGGGHTATVAGVRASAGFGRIAWNRHLAGHPAPHGTYTLTVKETVGSHTGATVLHVHL